MGVFSKLSSLLEKLSQQNDREAIATTCDEMRDLLRENIDFEEVVECLDDSVFITDVYCKVIYVNNS